MHDLLQPFTGLVGMWEGEGSGAYPTIEPFAYREEVRFEDVAGKPLLRYSSVTWALDDGRPLHAESGFLRAQPEGAVELVLAHGFGITEISTGSMVNGLLHLTSDVLVSSPSAKEVSTLVRRYEVHPASLRYEIGMAAAGQPLQEHLVATLERHSAPPRPVRRRGPTRP